jgi:protein-disulfide isomerase
VKVDTPYLIAGGVGLLAVLGGLAFWIWGGDADSTQTASSEDCVPKETFEVTAADYSLGKADAPVTIIEYASMTCIHCARFSRDVYPELKANYIDKGLVRYVFREFPLDQVALTASVVGRCLPREAYLSYVEAMYHEFDTWVRQEDLRSAIKEMARRAGMSGDEFEKCLSTEDDAKKVVAAQTQANKDYCITGTPTFLMNGKKLASGEIPWADLDAKLRAELKAKGVEAPATEAPAATEGTPAEGTPATEGAPPAETPAEAPKAETPATDSAPADATTPKPATETTPTP